MTNKIEEVQPGEIYIPISDMIKMSHAKFYLYEYPQTSSKRKILVTDKLLFVSKNLVKGKYLDLVEMTSSMSVRLSSSMFKFFRRIV